MDLIARTGYIAGVVGALLASGTVPCRAGNRGVQVALSGDAFAPGEEAKVRIVNDTGEPLWLPGCRPFELQAFERERFGAIPWKACASEGVATQVPAGTTELAFPVPSDRGNAILRVVVTWGRGCAPGLPLSEAGCRDFGTRTTHSFRVSHGG